MKRLLFLFVAAVIRSAHAIYPSDHWDFSTKLTEETYHETIAAEVEAGKTVFVRWIASEH